MGTFGDRRVLIVERFDRLWTGDQRLLCLPQEDSCQALSVPPTLKYQSDGGPGITDILKMLRGSDEPLSDQRSFLKANIAFWLMGATDGHAKNFSIFLSPGGRFRMTPLYDVISAQPSVDSKQILRKQFRLAMAFGTKPHYQIRQIAPRHFFQTADRAGVGGEIVESVVQELLDGGAAAVDSVLSRLPKNFPDQIATSIESGIKGRLRLLGNPGTRHLESMRSNASAKCTFESIGRFITADYSASNCPRMPTYGSLCSCGVLERSLTSAFCRK